MRQKTKNKNKFIWYILATFATLVLAIVFIPPMINLNFLKPKIESVIFNETGIRAKIHGNINFSLIGHATIIAHNISIPNGVISSCEFEIPVSDLFDLKKANISSDIVVHGASLAINEIIPFKINNKIIVNDSKFTFLNKEYTIIRADLSKNIVSASIRTDQHKYEIKSKDNHFIIENKNNDLYMYGQLFGNGTAAGHLDITAQNVNRWFEFDSPRITGQFPISADFTWNGSYGVNFENISADGVNGSVIFQEDGYKKIKLKSTKSDYDLSFFFQNPKILQNTSFDLDFYGQNRFLDKTFKHVYIKTTGSESEIKIDKIIADDFIIDGGTIDKNGAHNLHLSLPEQSVNTTCLFNGTPMKWSCDKFSYGKTLHGSIHTDKNIFNVNVYSSEKIEDIMMLINSSKRFGNTGTIKFVLPDMAGIIKIDKGKYNIKYDFVKNKNLSWANLDLYFIPDFIKNENGDFVWQNNTMIFVPYSKTWHISVDKDSFIIHGNDLKSWAPDEDLNSLKTLPFVISGNYKKDTISNLIVEILDQKFIGSASHKNITLKTDVLNIDSFVSKDFLDKFEELSFFVSHPLTVPFDMDINLAIAANALIFGNQTYNNFVYSLKQNTQTFSVSDLNRGNILSTIIKDNIKYSINIQLNKFVWNDKILPENMPLNISNTMITGEIKLKTYGKIAHDIKYNLNGTFDISFDGGKLYGLGIDNFYANANNITKLKVEDYLSDALTNGITNIKKMHIIGTYESGDIKTEKAFTFSMKHSDAVGLLDIKNNEMTAKLELVLRGTSAGPEPIELQIYPNNRREFSFSEIMMSFDPEYMREFIKTHVRF